MGKHVRSEKQATTALAVVEDSRQPATILPSTRRRIRASRAKGTVGNYKSAWEDFEEYARGRNCDALPASPQLVADYLDFLARGQQVATIEAKRAAIRWVHRSADLEDPTNTAVVRAVMQGIRREKGTKPNQKSPLILDSIRRIIAEIDVGTLTGKRDKAIILVGFAGAFRRSELVGTVVKHIERIDGGIRILVPRSKTDQQGQGMYKFIEAAEGLDICPVAALLDWLDSAGITEGSVFRRVDRWGKVYEGLTPQSVALIVKRRAKRAGFAVDDLAGHSLRAGFVTEAHERGVDLIDIMAQTGHKSEVTVRGYVRDAGRGAKRAARAVIRG